MELYPIKCKPILKERIWGGTKLKSLFKKEINSNITGESWELSSVDDNISTIENGIYKNKTLIELIKFFPNELLGYKVHTQYGNNFPLLFKFIDAREDLSVQLHPNDELAKKRHQSFGKTEMWYVVQADVNAELIVGFNGKSNQEEYLKHIKDNTVVSLLNRIKIKKGDVFFIESGTIHAIGAGAVIAEIQQTSDITYRVYDFERKDANGNQRELHNEMALEAINYDIVNAKKTYSNLTNFSNQAVSCNYFTTNVIVLQGVMMMNYNDDSFKVFMCVEGDFVLKFNNKEETIGTGETILIPAALTHFLLEGNATLLEIYI